MKVTEISYRELVNTGNFENITVEMKAIISEKDDVELASVKLSKKVKRALKEIRGEDY